MIDRIILTTNRIILRELEITDNYDWLEIFSSDKVAQFLVKMNDLEAINRLIAKKINKYKGLSGGSFSAILKSTQKVIGNVELKVSPDNKQAEISYVFNDKYWNKGYATECAKAVIDYAFGVLGVEKVVADCLSNNFSSCHILEDKLNMRLIKEEIPEGEDRAFKYFEILKIEWE